MKADPILQEIWDIKDRLAAEAGYDVDRFVDQLKKWTAEHPPTGPVVRNAEELRQLKDEIRDAVFGNAGSLVSFRVGPEDAEILERDLGPEIGAQDLVNLPNYSVYIQLMIDGSPSTPFSATTLHPNDLVH